jgi:methyltransferase (TIGR00027 family)
VKTRESAKRSAAGVATLRFLGSFERDPALANPDRMAGHFIGTLPRAAIAAAIIRPAVRLSVERRFPGAIAYHIARTKHFDRVLDEALGRGVEQLAILGAGYDTRALRMQERLSRVTVYEVDHPATLARKQRLLARLGGEPPANVHFVPVDFEHDDLGTRLASAGLHATRSTLFLWEGVSMFITADAVAQTLALVGTGMSALRMIAFDYVDADALVRPLDFYGAEAAHRHFERTGEPWRFGLDPRGIERFLGEHGLRMLSHLRAGEIEARYLTGARGASRGPMPDFHGFVHACATASA